jgi:hypothetical protein
LQLEGPTAVPHSLNLTALIFFPSARSGDRERLARTSADIHWSRRLREGGKPALFAVLSDRVIKIIDGIERTLR